MSATVDRAQAGDVGALPGSGGARDSADLAALALQLRERERRALLECDGPAHDRIRAEAAAVRTRLEDAAAGALARGHSLAGVSAAALSSCDARARFEAMGRLAAACARVAEVEEVLVDEARAPGGEMPADRSAQLRRALSLAPRPPCRRPGRRPPRRGADGAPRHHLDRRTRPRGGGPGVGLRGAGGAAAGGGQPGGERSGPAGRG